MPDVACAAIDRPELIEEYLAGDLDESSRESFEAHLFDCDRCLAHLQMLESLQAGLRAEAPAIRAETVGQQGLSWTWLAAAAVVAMAMAGLLLWRLSAPAPQPQIASGTRPTEPRSQLPPDTLLGLARLDPPRYVALELRGAGVRPSFEDAMRAYVAGDYKTAATKLRSVQASGTNDVQTDFFLAVALLMTDEAAGAIAPLRRVVSQGESPYQQLASLYLGKALVRGGDLDAADAEWTRTARLPGTHARDAEDLLKALRSARRP